MKNIFIIFIVILIVGLIDFVVIYNIVENKKTNPIVEEKQEFDLEADMKKYYNKYVITTKETSLYTYENNQYIKIGSINKDIELELSEPDYLNEYFYIPNLKYYIYYKDVTKIDNINTVEKDYENYIVFNENIVTNDIVSFYDKNKKNYVVEKSLSLPIIIKEDDSYGVEYGGKLLFVKKEDVKEIIDSKNTTLNHTDGIRTLVYHAFYDSSAGKYCSSIICHDKSQFESHLKYLKENDYYGVTMNDLEMFIDGKIQLPEKSVLLTIDDGEKSVIDIAIPLLNKYEINATMFLITSYGKKEEYYSPYLEIHSHSHNMHKTGICPGTDQGSPFVCHDREILLEDLKKSRELLDGSTVFCYPFYEYNDYAIQILKEAGFTMAFNGNWTKITVGSNKLELGRYTILRTTTLNEFIDLL